MRLSIALATCNGDRFLDAQLASIARQTRLPDELVACDDASTDDSVAILKRFGAAAPFPVRIECQPGNVGSTRTFERAIALCEGEVIALADQDDVWAPTKLALLVDLFARNPNLGLAFSDGLLVDANLVPTGQRLWQNKAFPPALQHSFERGEGARVLLRYNVVTGATCAFRAELRSRLLPIPPAWVHDAWIGIVAACLAEVKTIAEPLIEYRQHLAQQIGATQDSWWRRLGAASGRDPAYYQKRAETFQLLAERLAGRRLVDPALFDAIAGKVAHSRAQARIRAAPRLWRPLRALPALLAGDYHRYGRGLASFVVDAFL